DATVLGGGVHAVQERPWHADLHDGGGAGGVERLEHVLLGAPDAPEPVASGVVWHDGCAPVGSLARLIIGARVRPATSSPKPAGRMSCVWLRRGRWSRCARRRRTPTRLLASNRSPRARRPPGV